MPAATEYLEPNDSLRPASYNREAGSSSNEIDGRIREYARVRKYYDGNQDKTLMVEVDQPDDNITINMVRVSIDRMVAFLFRTMPRLEIEPHEQAESDTEVWLRRAWDTNGGVIFLQDVALNGAFSGHCYVRVLAPEAQDEYPGLINIDPTQVATYWRADDIRKVIWHEVHWTVEEGRMEVQYIQDFVNRGAYWDIVLYKKVGSTSFVVVEQSLWPYKYGPIIHWKHLLNPNKFYGKSEGQHLAMQDTINLVASETARIQRNHAAPKTIGTGFEADTVVTEGSVENLYIIPSADAKIYNLEMESNQSLSLELLSLLRDSYLAESSTTLLRGEIADFQRVTNAGIRTFFIDMLSKNATLIQHYGRGVQEISRIMGLLVFKKDVTTPVVIFSDPLPTDESESVNVLAIERSIGIVSRQTAAESRGRIWKDELERQKKEAQEEIFKEPEEESPESNSTEDRG